MPFHIVLVEPEIPQNTGNILRTCAATKCALTLVRPLGFSLSSRQLKRAGLDYWDFASLNVVDELSQVLDSPFFFLSTKGKKDYTNIPYVPGCKLVFGAESKGLDPEIHERYPHLFYRIPMVPEARSLNLANSAAITIYEGWRQCGFS